MSKVTNWLELKKYYDSENEKARLEMIKSIQERDKIWGDIKLQRELLNELKKQRKI